jgi:carbon-monoxide dehydrogenase large subunit
MIPRPDRNPLGVKGAGEGGALPTAAAVAAAVDDALRDRGVRADRHPLTPGIIRELIVSGAS